MTDSEKQLGALHAAVNCYLSTLLAVAQCLGDACPQVGEPYRHRLSRLRSRLAFDASEEALEESRTATETELKEYAAQASAYFDQHGAEFRRTIAALERTVQALAQRQDFYGARLRQFAAEMEATSYPADPGHLAEVVALQAAGLLGCVESMSSDAQSLVTRIRDEVASLERRLAETELTDPVTGLMNRREMERQIKVRRASGTPVTLLRFHLAGDISDEVARQASARLGSQFRYRDLICRWTHTEFLVLFHGPAETAQARAEQVVPWVGGRYLLDSGDSVQITVEARLAEPDLAAAS